MVLYNLLSKKRAVIIEKWFDVINGTYAPETACFLKSQKNQFTNPVGYTFRDGMQKLLDEILQGVDFVEIPPYLEDIVKIRAIQGFTPSQSLVFIFILKNIIAEELKDDLTPEIRREELPSINAKIDKIALLCFDIYVKCRERLYEIKVNEMRNLTSKYLERANQIYEAKAKEH